MYGSLLPNIISNVFSEFNIKVTFKTNNNISNLLHIKQPFPLEEKTGVYRMSCDCLLYTSRCV